MKYFRVKVSSPHRNYKTTYLVESDNLLTPDEIQNLFGSAMIHQLSIDGELEPMLEYEMKIHGSTEDGEVALPVNTSWEEMTPEDYLASLIDDAHVKEVFNLSSLGHVTDSSISINREFKDDIKGKTQYLSFCGISSSGEIFEDCKKITLQSNREKVIDKTYRDIVHNMRKYKRLPGLDLLRGFFVTAEISEEEYNEEINDGVLNL